MGRKLVLHGTRITDTTAPRIPDVDLIEAAGSLLLLDATHPIDPWPSGAPANGAHLPNLLSERARAVIGGTAELRPDWQTLANGGVAPTVRRTTRGGVYLAGKYAGPWHPAAVVDYFIANPSHAFYVSLWGVRDDSLGAGSISRLGPSAGKGTGAVYDLAGSGPIPTTTLTNSAGFPTSSVGTPYRAAAAYSSSTLAGTTGTELRNAYGAHLFGTWGAGGEFARRAYRYYLEDLTVSGRTWAEVNTIDAELYTAAVLTEGGRYHGDTIPA